MEISQQQHLHHAEQRNSLLERLLHRAQLPHLLWNLPLKEREQVSVLWGFSWPYECLCSPFCTPNLPHHHNLSPQTTPFISCIWPWSRYSQGPQIVATAPEQVHWPLWPSLYVSSSPHIHILPILNTLKPLEPTPGIEWDWILCNELPGQCNRTSCSILVASLPPLHFLPRLSPHSP